MTDMSDIVTKVETGMAGFDNIAQGGLPKGRTTLLAGTSGSAKTVFAIQFLAAGIENYGENAVFVTFEETPEDIRRNMKSLGWDIAAWEAAGKWAFVDAAPHVEATTTLIGHFDLGALLARIENAVDKVGAARLAMDSIGSVFSQLDDTSTVRNELFRIGAALKTLGVTALVTAERIDEYGEVARFGVEEFVNDNVVLLRNVLAGEKRRRTVEILKFRGTLHQKGEYPFTVMSDEGVVVNPLSAITLNQKSSTVRVPSGNPVLDEMCGGGFFRDSIVLLSGATGCGKTLMSTEFISGGAKNGERCMMFAFEESHEQLCRNAMGWGRDFEQMEEDGLLRIVAAYPESASLEDQLISINKQMDEFQPSRVAVDSLTALSRVSSSKGFREFVISLTSSLKDREITAMFTSTTSSMLGGEAITEDHISTITDSIILLRYVEMFGEMHRGLTLLKMRGSLHDKDIREFSIDNEGMHIGKAFSNVTGILSGRPHHVSTTEVERLGGLFRDRRASTPK